MTDIAALGFAVDSGPLDRSSSSLDRLTGAAKRAEAASAGAASGLNGAAAAAGNASTSKSLLARILERVIGFFRGEASAADSSTAALKRNAVASDLALGTVTKHGGAANAQMLALTHSVRSVTEQLALGVPPTQALIGQFSHLTYVISSPGGLAFLGRIIGAIAAPVLALVGVFAGLTTKINETAATQVGFGEVFRATIEVAARAIGDFFKPAIDQLGSWWQQFVDWITPLFKNVVNTIVGTFVFGFNAVKDTWSLLPEAFASIFTKAMNGAIDIVQNGINGIIGPVNGLLEKVGLSSIPLADLSQFKGTPSNADQKVGSIISADATAAFSTDYAGQAFNAISQKAQQLALADAAEKAKKAAKGTSDTIRGPLTDGIDKLTAKTSAWADAATSAFSNLGTGIVNAFTKGGNVAMNVLDMLLGKIGDFGTSLLNSGLNSLLNAAIGGITGAMTPTGGVWGNGLWGSAIFAGVHHNGGVAGSPTMGRTVPASLFDGALRYHGGGIAGLRPDEVPAILQRGERITPANQNGAPNFSISVTVNADSTTNGAAVARQVAQELRRQVPDLIAASQRNPYRRTA